MFDNYEQIMVLIEKMGNLDLSNLIDELGREIANLSDSQRRFELKLSNMERMEQFSPDVFMMKYIRHRDEFFLTYFS